MEGPDRELILLRHAKSAWNTDASTDFDRPLAPRGRRDAPRMGRWLAERDLRPDRIVSSPASRARETAEVVAGALGLDAGDVVFDERVYEAGAAALLEVVRGLPAEARRVLVVGHNPGLESLVRVLGARTVPPCDGTFFPTAAVARLRVARPWSELGAGDAEVLEIVRPKSLKR